VFRVQVRLGGATQFSAATPIVTFQEGTGINGQLAPDQAARIMGYAYNSQGAAHTVRLVLAAAAGGNADEEIILEAPSAAVNSFTQLCGPDGLVVPRRFGIESVAQPPVGTVTSAQTFVALFSTVGKAAAATFSLWYKVGSVA